MSTFIPFYRKWTTNDIQKIVDVFGISLEDQYFISTKHRHIWKCKKHNHIFTRSFTQIHHGGLHCDKCRDEIGKWNPKTQKPIELDFKNPKSYWNKNKKKIADKIEKLGLSPKRGRIKFTVKSVHNIIDPIMRNLKVANYIVHDGKTDLRTRPIKIGTDLKSKADYITKCGQIFKILNPHHA